MKSRSTSQTFSCPCGQEFSGTIYEYVNAAQDTRLRYITLAGMLNVATCPFCGRKAAIACPFIYSDPQYDLLAYVHPNAHAPEEARQLILDRLRSVYIDLANEQEGEQNSPAGDRRAKLTADQARELPPLKVVFGLDELYELLNATLPPDERLGKLAMNTLSRDSAERGQFLTIARKMAADADCAIEVEDLPDEYIVRLYGARRNISMLMRSLSAVG